MKRLYVDMDGTLARFHDEVKCLERMYEKEFFLNLKPFWSIVNAIEYLASEGEVEVYILSSCVSDLCREEKRKWLKEYLPHIPECRYILVPVGCNKSLYIGHPITEDDVLLDDYNRNLEEWQAAGGRSIKLVNNINHKGLFGPLWQGRCCYEKLESPVIIENLKTMIC